MKKILNRGFNRGFLTEVVYLLFALNRGKQRKMFEHQDKCCRKTYVIAFIAFKC